MLQLTSRTFIELDVELWYQHSSLGIFKTRDIDDRAVFIEASGLGLHPHDVIKAEFQINQNGVLRFPLEGEVIRCVDSGIAVLFLSGVIGFFQALNEDMFFFPLHYGDSKKFPEESGVSVGRAFGKAPKSNKQDAA